MLLRTRLKMAKEDVLGSKVVEKTKQVGVSAGHVVTEVAGMTAWMVARMFSPITRKARELHKQYRTEHRTDERTD